MAQLKKTILDEFVLPCDFIVGNIRFGKGVKLETVRAAAERWLVRASELWPPVTKEQSEAIEKLVAPEFETGDWRWIEKE